MGVLAPLPAGQEADAAPVPQPGGPAPDGQVRVDNAKFPDQASPGLGVGEGVGPFDEVLGLLLPLLLAHGHLPLSLALLDVLGRPGGLGGRGAVAFNLEVALLYFICWGGWVCY